MFFCQSGPPCCSIKAAPPGSHPPYCTQPLIAFEEDKGGGQHWAAVATAAMVDAAHDGKGSTMREREAVMQQPAGAREARREMHSLMRVQERGGARREGLSNEKGGGMTREAAM
jgi:hypothetical protein